MPQSSAQAAWRNRLGAHSELVNVVVTFGARCAKVGVMPENHQNPPPQFTLRQLMVLVAILSVILAVAVLSLRDNRTNHRGNTCRNNLRNLALAAFQYENRNGFYPGIVEWAEDSSGGGPWMRPMAYNMFLDLERSDLFELYSRDNVSSNTLPKPAHLELFQCPANAVRTGTACSYVINAAFWHDGQNWEVAPWAGISFWNHAGTNQNLNNSDRFVSNHDGASATMLFAENLDASSWTADFSTPQWAGRYFHWGNYPPKWQQEYFRPNAKNKGTQRHQGSTNLIARPSSNHAKSMNVAFCNIHVKVVKENIDYRVYAHLCTPFGQEQKQCPPRSSSYVNVWQQPLRDGEY
jgi:hypothetical protein